MNFVLPLFGCDLPFTTPTQAKLTTVGLIIAFLGNAARRRTIVPGRSQAAAAWACVFILDVVTKNAGQEARSAVAVVPCLFVLMSVGTLIGIIPIKKTFAAHIAATMTLPLAAFAYVRVSRHSARMDFTFSLLLAGARADLLGAARRDHLGLLAFALTEAVALSALIVAFLIQSVG